MLKRAKKIQIVIAFLAATLAMTASASAQVTKTQIQRMNPWASCTTCAGIGGAGPSSSIATAAGLASPSMTGHARVFQIASSHAYADALWWRQVGAANAAHNLVYDVYFYIKNPAAAQALEFDSNQSNGRKLFIFGTQCAIRSGVWEVWGNAAGSWKSTGSPCAQPTAFKWHHLTWEFKRTETQLQFVALTYDGVKHYVNRTYPARASGTSGLNVAFQMDQRANHVTYQTWLDNVSLKYW